jgi:hypothetical protein
MWEAILGELGMTFPDPSAVDVQTVIAHIMD